MACLKLLVKTLFYEPDVISFWSSLAIIKNNMKLGLVKYIDIPQKKVMLITEAKR